MKACIEILHLEDDPNDIELIQAMLVEAGLNVRIDHVQKRNEFELALRKDRYNLVLADFKLPQFDGISALQMVLELCPDIPFIFVSGTMGEEAAIDGLTQGATDYVLKQNLTRLVPAVKRALQEVADRQQRRRAEESLRHAHEYLNQLISSANVMIIGLDARGHVRIFNQAAERITGYTVDELKGINWFEKNVPRNRYAYVWETFQRHQQKIGTLPETFENPILTKTGQERIISWQNSTITAPEAEISTISFGMDITERRQAEQRLTQYQQRLRSLAVELVLTEERERRRLAEVLHDEVAQTLVFSKMKLQCLKQDIPDSMTAAETDDILDMLTETLTEIHSLTSELASPVLRELGLEQAVAAWLRDRIEARHHLKTEFINDGQSKPLEDDLCTLVFRCIRELLSNVVKHARASWVRVSLDVVEDRLRVSVEDDGVGYPPEILTGNVGTQRFGLFSIQEGLNSVGGTLRLELRPNKGSRTILEVPLQRSTSLEERTNECSDHAGGFHVS